MQKLIFTLFVLLIANISSAQFMDDFADDNLMDNPLWQGDVIDFIVNEDEELQLMASEAGESQIYLTTSFVDSIEWDFYIKLAFSPSANNRLRIDLMTDNIDLSIANSYYLEVGENGSGDAFSFYKQEQGISTLLGQATMGSMSASSNMARVKVIKRADGMWNVSIDYDGGIGFENEIELMDTSLDIQEGYFSIFCKYSASRNDKFFFDDISMNELSSDETAPRLIKLVVTSSSELVLFYDEGLKAESAENISNYSIDNGIGQPTGATYNEIDYSIKLQLNPVLNSGTVYTISIHNIEDASGNTSEEMEEFYLVQEPSVGDLLVNEVLFRPSQGASDFVEIYNASDKIISLANVELWNFQRTSGLFKRINNDLQILPKSYLAFSKAAEELIEVYSVMDENTLIQNDLPAFNSDKGNVSIVLRQDRIIVIDSFDYSSSMHFPLLDDTKGVSLERISESDNTNHKDNWTSGSYTTNFATPGYQNANSSVLSVQLDEIVVIKQPTFSPNGDGFEDQLLIEFSTSGSNNILNMKIYDMVGREIYSSFNLPIPANGFVSWNGINSEGVIADIGPYIVWLEIFDLDGNVHQIKKSVILADILN